MEMKWYFIFAVVAMVAIFGNHAYENYQYSQCASAYASSNRTAAQIKAICTQADVSISISSKKN